MHSGELALRIRRSRRIQGSLTTDSLYSICKHYGLDIIRYDFSRIDEVYLNGVVGLRPDLSTSEERWYLAHALGHHLRHDGNQLAQSTSDQAWWTTRQERSANLFAGFLIWGRLVSAESITTYDLAERYDVPEECVENWRRIVLDGQPSRRKAAIRLSLPSEVLPVK